MLIDSVNVQSGKWPSPHELPCNAGRSYHTFPEWIYEVKNEPVHFDSKPNPSCWSSAKRTLMAVLRKLVRVFQAAPRKQASQVPCQGQTTNRSLDISNTGLMTKKPRTAEVLRYIDQLVKATDIGWADANQDNPKRLIDQEARRDFNRMVLTIGLKWLSFDSCTRMLKHLEGEYGQHLRGVLDFAAEQVGQTEEDPVKVSIAYKYPTFVEDVIIALHERLGRYDVLVEPGANIRRYSELTSRDIKALSCVGIGADLSASNA